NGSAVGTVQVLVLDATATRDITIASAINANGGAGNTTGGAGGAVTVQVHSSVLATGGVTLSAPINANGGNGTTTGGVGGTITLISQGVASPLIPADITLNSTLTATAGTGAG